MVGPLPPWPLIAAAMLSIGGVLLPLGYLLYQMAWLGDVSDPLWTEANWRRLWRTLILAAGVGAATTVLAFPLAWLSSRSDLWLRRCWTVAAILPLSIPAYVMAYAALSLGGDDGVLVRLLGMESSWLAPLVSVDVHGTAHVPRISGYWGAMLVLTMYNLPYLFLPLRAAYVSIDPTLEEAAAVLGRTRQQVFFRVVLPQLMPAYLAGSLLVGLHVLADFGVVSLMRYDTLSAVLFAKFNTFDVPGAAQIAGLLLFVAAGMIAIEMLLLRRVRLERIAGGSRRSMSRTRLGWWQLPAVAIFSCVFLMGVMIPLMTISFWMIRSWQVEAWGEVWSAAWDSVRGSLPAALVATALAIPIAMLRARYPSRLAYLLERLPFIGYAVPGLAFALSLIMLVTSESTPDWLFELLYQSLPLLVFAYALHFLAEALGPIRSSFYLVPRQVEEAARMLGRPRLRVFFTVTLPLLRPGVIASAVLVFLSCLKELPLTMLLAPSGFETLAMSVWNYSENVEFARAAPFALLIVACSALFVALTQGAFPSWEESPRGDETSLQRALPTTAAWQGEPPSSGA